MREAETSFAGEKILSWLGRLGPDGSIEIRRNTLIDGVEILASSRGKRACQLITLQQVREVDSNVITEQIEHVVEALTALW